MAFTKRICRRGGDMGRVLNVVKTTKNPKTGEDNNAIGEDNGLKMRYMTKKFTGCVTAGSGLRWPLVWNWCAVGPSLHFTGFLGGDVKKSFLFHDLQRSCKTFPKPLKHLECFHDNIITGRFRLRI